MGQAEYYEADYNIKKLIKELNDLISARNAEIETEDIKHNQVVDVINANYQPQLDTKQAEINAETTNLNNSLKP